MMVMRVRTMGFIVMSSLCMFFSPAQSQSRQAGPRLSTVDEARNNSPLSIQLEAYKLGTFTLGCNLPDGSLVEITPVADSSEFTFLAIKSKKSPLILANERFIKRQDIAYAVFSFYRECAMHTVTVVQTKGPGDGDLYDRDIVNAAECLAVLPTRKTLGESKSLPLFHIADRLRDEYGVGSSTSSALKRCVTPDYVRKMLEKLPRKR